MITERKHYASILSLVLALVVILPAGAQAALYGFGAITNNSLISPTVAGQLAVEVTSSGSGALFTFYNDGPSGSAYDVPSPITSEITTIYFDDTAGVLSGLSSITQTPVGFTDLAGEAAIGSLPDPPYDIKPANLPSGSTVGFFADGALSAQRTSAPSGGVDVGEYVALLYNIAGGKTFADVISALNLGATGVDALRIGLHVQQIPFGTGTTSDSFVNTPVPGAVILGLLGLGIAGWKMRRFA